MKQELKICKICSAKPSEKFIDGKIKAEKFDEDGICAGCQYKKYENRNFARNNLTKIKL